MKRITIIMTTIISLMLLHIPSALADPIDWSDPHYDFKKVTTALVYDLDIENSRLHNGVLAKRVSAAYEKDTSKLKLNIMPLKKINDKISLKHNFDMDQLYLTDPDEATKIFKDEAGEYIDVYITATMEKCHEYINHYPAYTSWETESRWHTWYDRNGNSHTDRYYVTVPRFHPAHDETAIMVKMHYQVYDSKSHQLVYEREDVRERETDDPQGMLNRSFESFVNAFNKLIKK